ncbi:hypothetical protein D3C85_1788160 [compost metagenome]
MAAGIATAGNVTPSMTCRAVAPLSVRCFSLMNSMPVDRSLRRPKVMNEVDRLVWLARISFCWSSS